MSAIDACMPSRQIRIGDEEYEGPGAQGGQWKGGGGVCGRMLA